MAAYYRRFGEDRATEVFSTVLSRVPALVTGLADLAGFEPPARSEVVTQRTEGARTIDLEVAGFDDSNQGLWILWSEHKTWSRLTVDQLEGESVSLAARTGSTPARLIAITVTVPSSDVRRAAARNDWRLLTWNDVRVMSRRVSKALESDANASAIEKHLVEEWIDFMDHELEPSAEPLTASRVAVIPELAPIAHTIDHLETAGVNRACNACGLPPAKHFSNPGYWEVAAPDGSWCQGQGLKLVAQTILEEELYYGSMAEPAFVAGAWVNGEEANTVRSAGGLDANLSKLGLDRDEADDRHSNWIQWTLALPLKSVVAAGATLEQQEDAVARHCEKAFSLMLELGD